MLPGFGGLVCLPPSAMLVKTIRIMALFIPAHLFRQLARFLRALLFVCLAGNTCMGLNCT